METIFMVVEVEDKGMFNDFLMGKPVIGNQYESGPNNLLGGVVDEDVTEIEIFNNLPIEEKEKLIREYVAQNAEVLAIDWNGND